MKKHNSVSTSIGLASFADDDDYGEFIHPQDMMKHFTHRETCAMICQEWPFHFGEVEETHIGDQVDRACILCR
jgi:hypothetical protein